jgi:elongation factor P hydroxylase
VGLFDKFFSKTTDPQLERFAQTIAQTLAECKKPRSFAAAAVEGARTRSRFFTLLEKFEAETGRAGISFQDVVEGKGLMFVEQQLMELIQKQSDNKLLEAALYDAFSTPDITRQANEALPTLIAMHQAKPNTEHVLAEKAYILSRHILHNLGIGTDVYNVLSEAWKDTFCGHELSYEENQAVKIEESAIWFRVIDDMAYWYIPAERSLFMDHFEECFGYHLALQGASPAAVSKTMEDRLREYSAYQKWVQEPEEGAKGTLLWEAGKHVMAALGLSEHIFFQVYFAKMFLESAIQAVVYELLSGKNRPGNT